jgi:hypothetical protein
VRRASTTTATMKLTPKIAQSSRSSPVPLITSSVFERRRLRTASRLSLLSAVAKAK